MCISGNLSSLITYGAFAGSVKGELSPEAKNLILNLCADARLENEPDNPRPDPFRVDTRKRQKEINDERVTAACIWALVKYKKRISIERIKNDD